MAKSQDRMMKGTNLVKTDFTMPKDATRSMITSAAPPETSIYSNPVSMMAERRNPASVQVGMAPNMKISIEKKGR